MKLTQSDIPIFFDALTSFSQRKNQYPSSNRRFSKEEIFKKRHHQYAIDVN